MPRARLVHLRERVGSGRDQLWDRKENADAYGRNTYPRVLKTLANVVEGTPTVESYEVSSSTFHKIASSN